MKITLAEITSKIKGLNQSINWGSFYAL